MRECVCGTQTLDDRRTCPNCGREINPAGIDPAVQDQRRSTTIIAELRAEAIELRKSMSASEQSRTVAEERASSLQQSLAELADEHRDLVTELRELKERFQAVEERSRLLRAQFEALGISTYRSFDASQAPLFHSEFGDSAKAAVKPHDEAAQE